MRSSDPEDGEARAGFLPAPHAIASDPAPVNAAVFTIDADTPIRPWKLSAKSWAFAAIIVIASVGIRQSVIRRAIPPSSAPVIPSRASALPPPAARPLPAAPPVVQPHNPATVHEPDGEKAESDGGKKKKNNDHALDRLRAAIAQQLRRAGELIDLQAFDQAEEELEQIAAEIQRFPAELADEREQHRELQRRLIAARVDAETARAKQALEQAEWERRLGLIESQLKKGSFPEAEKLATNLIDDPSVPASITDRARELRQRAKDGLKQIFSDTRTGPTTNTIRKP